MHRRCTSESGFTLVELLMAMTITTVVIGATLSGVSNATKANDTVMKITRVNGSLQAGMDLMFNDLLQAGAGLPKGHVIQIPSGGGLQVRRPGPPGTAYADRRSRSDDSRGHSRRPTGPRGQRRGHGHDHHPGG